MAAINLVVLGTSLAWGQGLEEHDKIHHKLGRMIEAGSPDRELNIHLLAHSGASTGYQLDGTVDTQRKPRVHGEVPTLYPTILQQIDEFDERGVSPDSVQIIVLDAGINDVHVTTILNPLSNPKQIEELVEVYCFEHVSKLLAKVCEKFSNASIIVLGYYRILTDQSEDGYVKALLHALEQVPMNQVVDGVLSIFDGPLKRRLLDNCDTFSQCSQSALERAAHSVNEQLDHDRIFVIDAAFATQHAAFTTDPWLFGIREDLAPEDPMATARDEACKSAGPLRTAVIFCKKASVGHPNPRGAQAYAEAIYSLITEKALL